jgi:PAS domain S-box-containing protein
VDVEVAATPTSYRGEVAVQVVSRDITARKKAAEELVVLRKAVESSGAAIFLTDRNGVITYVNPEFTRVYGYPASDVVGKMTPRILKSGVYDSQIYQEFWAAIIRGEAIKGEMVNRAADGHLVHVSGSANPIHDETGRLIGFLGIQHDVSDRVLAEKALRDSADGLRWLVENLEQAVGIVDPNERIVYANAAWGALMGQDADDLIGRSLGAFLDPESFEMVKQITETRREGVRSRYKVYGARADGKRRVFEVSAVPQFDRAGKLVNVVAAMRDISASEGLPS